MNREQIYRNEDYYFIKHIYLDINKKQSSLEEAPKLFISRVKNEIGEFNE